ncbi:hypothetical protein [Brevibacillus nitrificans]|uniref:hypothetical protein n=1 Tax=Brevibacillus nitrificans TaxID=651560 RepID=UPI0026277EFF|nr:hypothetical protein [Brevibacillus nitrificans]
MKRGITILVALVIVIAGIYFTLDKTKHTTFKEALLDKINESDVVTIEIERYSDSAKASISDKTVVEEILNDFSSMELKKTNESKPVGAYALRIYVNNSGNLGMEVLQDKNYVWLMNNDSSNVYKVTNNFDPLKAIEEEKLDFKPKVE